MIAVSQMMSKDSFQFLGSESLREASAALLARSLHGAPVVDDAGRPFGVVSHVDLLRALLMDPTSRLKVADIATRPPITIAPDAGVYEAAEQMVRANVHRLPVVDHDGVLQGVVTPMDLLRGIVNLEAGFRVRKAPSDGEAGS